MKLLAPAHWSDYVRRNRLRILMYHAISTETNDRLTVQPKMFAAHMQYLARHAWNVVSLCDALSLLSTGSDLRHKVVLTFDDGYADFSTYALPILKAHRFPATLFVVTGYLGQTAAWSSSDRSRALLTAEEIRAIRSDRISIGYHTRTHPDLTRLDSSALEGEIYRARDDLELYDDSFVPFAYPGGRFGARERTAVEQAGYACAVTVGGRWGNGPETDRFALKREPMLASDTLDWFARRVNGWYELDYFRARAEGIRTR